MSDERIISSPPPILKSEGEILRELPNTLGLVLWQDLRHLQDWAESSDEVRGRLFQIPTLEVHAKRREARLAATELSGALDLFAGLKLDPASAEPPVIAAACDQVVRWSLHHEHMRTAVEWADLAARVDLLNPKRANIAGRLTRLVNAYYQSEVWFKRGIRLAQDQKNVAEQVWGHLGYGRLCQEIGWVAGARKHLGRGSQLAWKDGPPSLAASAQHDLAAMLMVRGHLDEAAATARRALMWYPKNHVRLPYFAADVGLMLVLGSRFAAAARIVRAALRSIKQPSVRTMVTALGARAFAGMGEPEESAVMRRRSLKMLEKHNQLELVTRWHLADAQRLAGKWDAAEAEAQETLSKAVAEKDHEVVRLTRILLRLITERRSARPNRRTDAELRDFVQLLNQRLQEWSPRRRSNPGPWGEDRAA